MTEVIIGSAILSMLHALLPNHWLPIIAIARRQKWTLSETLMVTGFGALAHSLSTVLIGLLVGYLGYALAEKYSFFLSLVAPALLILMGIFFIYQHHSHNHFHLSTSKLETLTSKWKFILLLVFAMMLSPCLEISGYFLIAGGNGMDEVALISAIYASCTVIGMLIWVWWLYPHVQKLDWHALEHKAGLLAGWILIGTGVVSFFIH